MNGIQQEQATTAPKAPFAAANDALQSLAVLLADAGVSDVQFARESKYLLASGSFGGPILTYVLPYWVALPIVPPYFIGLAFHQPNLGLAAGLLMSVLPRLLIPGLWRRWCRLFIEYRLWQASRARTDWPRLAWIAQQLLCRFPPEKNQRELTSFISAAAAGNPPSRARAHTWFWAWLSQQARDVAAAAPHASAEPVAIPLGRPAVP